MGCESEKEIERLKTTVQAKLGENFNVTETSQKPKIKIIKVEEDEMKM